MQTMWRAPPQERLYIGFISWELFGNLAYGAKFPGFWPFDSWRKPAVAIVIAQVLAVLLAIVRH
jgi:hypothetical protein